MVKKKIIKKKKTLTEKIQKELDKLDALHEKEEAVIENIQQFIYDEEEEDE